MLARLAVLLALLPALALAAAVGADRPRPASAQRVATAPVIKPPTPLGAPADPAQCRMGCAQTYYFCREGDHPEECAGPWGQCVATCNSPNLAPGYSTAP